MNRLRCARLFSLLACRKGIAAVEYALMAAALVVCLSILLPAMGSRMGTVYGDVRVSLATAGNEVVSQVPPPPIQRGND